MSSADPLDSAHLIRAEIGALPATLSAVDLLARLHLECRRAGYDLLLEGAAPELRDLALGCGLARLFSSDRARERKDR